MSGDTVLVASGVYVENISFLGKAITVQSSGGPDVTFIEGTNPADPDRASVVFFENLEGPDSILKGFTILGGNGTRFLLPMDHSLAGGILCDDSAPTIIGNFIVGNSADIGGGIGCVNSATPFIQDNISLKITEA